MHNNEKYLIVKKYIDIMDYYGLLACGAPEDEFDSESEEIAARIHPGLSSDEIATVIADVFIANFNEYKEDEWFLPVAEQIKNALDNY